MHNRIPKNYRIKMPTLNLPNAQLKTTIKENKTYVFDILRKKYVVYTPEEQVRQHFIHYMISSLGYPSGLLSNEVQIRLNNTIKRCDTVLYGTDYHPRMIIEYKAPDVPITREVFNQITRYNIVLHVDYLIVSNGIQHYCCHVDYRTGKCSFLPQIPHYTEL